MAALLTKTLAVICPSCDFLNVVGAVRCMSCGTATDAQVVTQPAAHVEPDRTPPSASPLPAPAAPAPQPPGLRRSSGTPTTPGGGAAAPARVETPTPVPAVEPLGTALPPSGAFRGPPPRPTFQSSSSSAAHAAPAAGAAHRFGLTVQAGPARGQRFRLSATGAQIGRSRGAILFTEDPFVSPLHASLTVRDGKLFIRDEGSTSGVYVSIAGQETIPPGGTFATGLRLFRFVSAIEAAPPWNHTDVVVYGSPVPQMVFLIEEILLGDRPGRAIVTPGPVITIGQGRCDFSFPNDEGLAPRHCEIAPLPTGAMIRDLSAGLGTFIRVSGERGLKPGDRVRIGQQTLQVDQL